MLGNDRVLATDIHLLSLSPFVQNFLVSFLDTVSFRLFAKLLELLQKCDFPSVNLLQLILCFLRDFRAVSVKEGMKVAICTATLSNFLVVDLPHQTDGLRLVVAYVERDE